MPFEKSIKEYSEKLENITKVFKSVSKVSSNSATFNELKNRTHLLEEALHKTVENVENRISIVVTQKNRTSLMVQNVTENIKNLMENLNKTRTKLNY